jgi:hypothetical protein
MKPAPQHTFRPEIEEALDLVAGLVADKVMTTEVQRQQRIVGQRVRLTEAGRARLRQHREARA